MMYVGSAVFLVGLAWLAMRWAGKTVKKDLDPARTGRMRESMAVKADVVPPAMVKEALAKGLVTSQQLATMSPIERQFLFNELRSKLTGSTSAPGAPAAAAAPLSSVPLPLKPSAPDAAPHNAAQLRSTQAMVAIPRPGAPPLPPLQPPPIATPVAAPVATPIATPVARPAAPPAARPITPQSTPALGATKSPGSTSPFDEPAALQLHCPCCGTPLVLPAFPPIVAFCDQCGAKTAVRTEEQGRLVINTAPPGVTRRPVR